MENCWIEDSLVGHCVIATLIISICRAKYYSGLLSETVTINIKHKLSLYLLLKQCLGSSGLPIQIDILLLSFHCILIDTHSDHVDQMRENGVVRYVSEGRISL